MEGPLSPYLRGRTKKEGPVVLELIEKLQKANDKVDQQIAEEHQLRNEVLQMAPRAMKKYLDTRFERLKNAKLEFPQMADSERKSEAELAKAKEELRQLKLQAAEEAEEQKRELEEAQRMERELKERVNRKLAKLRALEEISVRSNANSPSAATEWFHRKFGAAIQLSERKKNECERKQKKQSYQEVKKNLEKCLAIRRQEAYERRCNFYNAENELFEEEGEKEEEEEEKEEGGEGNESEKEAAEEELENNEAEEEEESDGEEENEDDNEELEEGGVVTEEEEEEEMSDGKEMEAKGVETPTAEEEEREKEEEDEQQEEKEEGEDEKECKEKEKETDYESGDEGIELVRRKVPANGKEQKENPMDDAAIKRKLVDLFDDEASLSGDDVGSDSDGETQDEPDEYEAEEGDLDQLPDTEEIRENLVRQYLKHQNDDSDRKLLRLQEAFFADSDLHGQGGGGDRSFRFRMHADANVDWAKLLGTTDGENEGEDEDGEEQRQAEEEWHKKRLQMIKWRAEQEERNRRAKKRTRQDDDGEEGASGRRKDADDEKGPIVELLELDSPLFALGKKLLCAAKDANSASPSSSRVVASSSLLPSASLFADVSIPPPQKRRDSLLNSYLRRTDAATVRIVSSPFVEHFHLPNDRQNI
ncbi:hypothetical protein niasHS_011148 [Heterodera schachtii]|uniref:Uncharacterized protein n=1 Tax=Heterodera schachtii TaxID=97005 RepID=A0ABD2IVJ9_HETSC